MKQVEMGSSKEYLVTFLSLQILLIVTFLVAHLNLGRWSLVVALIIASIKALLVVFCFMHLRQSKEITRIAAGVGVFWFGILVCLTLTDYISRSWLFLPGFWP